MKRRRRSNQPDHADLIEYLPPGFSGTDVFPLVDMPASELIPSLPADPPPPPPPPAPTYEVSPFSWPPAETNTASTLKFMPPGHFCPDVCGLEDFGQADYLRGRAVRAFFWVMRFWPHPTIDRSSRSRHG